MKVKEFQKLMKDLFIENDENRGAEKTYIWFVEEVGELGSAILKGDRENIKEELADVIAWTCSIANLYDIDIEECLDTKYPDQCIYCKKNPCICEKKKVL